MGQTESAGPSNLSSQQSGDAPAEDLYADIEGEEELLSSAQNRLPALSADGLRALAQKQHVSTNENSSEPSLPQLSASGRAKLAELYNPEDITEDDDQDGLVIDTAKLSEDPMRDTEKISEDEDEQVVEDKKFKIQLKSNNKMIKNTLTQSPRKKNIIADIFGSDDEDEQGADDGKSDKKPSEGTSSSVQQEGANKKDDEEGPSEAAASSAVKVGQPSKLPDGKCYIEAESDQEVEDQIGTTVEDMGMIANEDAINEIISEAVNAATVAQQLALKEDGSLEDVSDKEMLNEKEDAEDSNREVRMRELSVSPINSEQSESFEKAATLEGLNPEAISPEEDFTSLSEEEEGEIKNYERRKKLKLRKRELQRKVRELERQVIEISPSRAAVIANGGSLEDGEINEEKKKKKTKEKEKVKKKARKEPEQGVSENAQKENDPKENSSKSSRSYRKKETGPEEKENEGKEEDTVKVARRK